MQVTYDPKRKVLVIEVVADVETPRPSSTGTTLLVASDSSKTAIAVKNLPLTVSVNAYIKPPKAK
jgi:hypothetical protein